MKLQDTNRHIMEALFTFQAAYKGEVVVGLFGDMMQRIYGDGQPGLGENLPADWATPTKMLNFRCPRRVIKLINNPANPLMARPRLLAARLRKAISGC
ncbi:hypothetical protein CDEF62S_01602 [Castellaniella defragrans]